MRNLTTVAEVLVVIEAGSIASELREDRAESFRDETAGEDVAQVVPLAFPNRKSPLVANFDVAARLDRAFLRGVVARGGRVISVTVL